MIKPTHDSIRGWFAAALYNEMEKNDNIWLLVGDLGFGMMDKIRDDFPKRFVNVGASEQALLGAGIGLALEGQIPFLYSITTFLLYRPFEWIRYANHENIPIRLVGSGFEADYTHDGASHQPFDLDLYFHQFDKITFHIPNNKAMVPVIVWNMISYNNPSFLCLRR